MKKIVFSLSLLIGTVIARFVFFGPTPLEKAEKAFAAGKPAVSVSIVTHALESSQMKSNEEIPLRELLARSYLAKGSLEMAEIEWRSLIKKDPKNFEAHLGLGSLNFAMDRLNFAKDYLIVAKSIKPNDFRPVFLLGALLTEKRDFDEAENLIKSALLQWPENHKLTEILGDIYFDRGYFREALSTYSLLVNDTTSDWPIKFKQAKAFLFSGDLSSAEKLVKELRPKGREDVSVEALNAHILYAQGKKDEYFSYWKKVYKEDNRNLESGVVVAIYLAEKGDYSGAEILLKPMEEKLLPLGGLNSPYEGLTTQDLERLQAIKKAALKQHLSYQLANAKIAELKNQYNTAETFINRSLALDSEDAEVLLAAAKLAHLKGSPKDELNWTQKLVDTYKGHPLALIQRANALYSLGKYADFISDVQAVADAYPKMAQAQALMVKSFLLQKNKQKALEFAKIAIQLNPGDSTAHLSLALAQSALGYHESAKSSFLKSISLDPRNAETRYLFSKELLATGQKKESETQWQEAHQLEPLVYAQ